MRDRLWIAAGLALFLALFTYPVWRAAAMHTRAAAPQLSSQGTKCVASAEFMRESHMRLLYQWRADVVRNGVRQMHTADGHTYNMSLSHTCLNCHSKTEFCDRCHTYSGVSGASGLSCWKCHNDPHNVTAKVTQ
ncbi:MAG: sulfate reduction electron transfer complex DsrMKJOP subunit DsrJ [Acidobacteriaceae bacterium]|nr:sulfate reduction electron transfer complex DsrMKJOP subunit DsrJ [Acidobacteriaceae bacterium]